MDADIIGVQPKHTLYYSQIGISKETIVKQSDIRYNNLKALACALVDNMTDEQAAKVLDKLGY